MSNQFFIVLPSNTQGYVDNTPNKFRVRLPKTLDLSGNWVCGLHSIVYNYSWSLSGTTENQWMDLQFSSRKGIKVPIPQFSFTSAEQIQSSLLPIINQGLDNAFKLRNDNSNENNNITRAKRTAEWEMRQNKTPQSPPKEPEKAPMPLEPESSQIVIDNEPVNNIEDIDEYKHLKNISRLLVLS